MVKPKNRKRYIGFKIISDKEIEPKEFEKAVKDSFMRLFGEFGLSSANPKLLYEFWDKNTGVLQTNNIAIPKIKISLALLKEIGGIKIIVQTLKVFGTLKKIKERF